MADDFKKLSKRREAAWAEKNKWQSLINEAYDYVAPHRRSNRLGERSPSSLTSKIFDNTPILSMQRSIGNLQQSLLPPGQKWFELKPGPAASAHGFDYDELSKELETISNQIQPVFLTGEWDNSVSELLEDVFISTGCMFVLKGDRYNPVRFLTPSIDEVAIDCGPHGETTGVFWKRKWKRRDIKEKWPNGKFSASFEQKLQNNGEEAVELNQDIIHDAENQRWNWSVSLEGESEAGAISQEHHDECPCLTSRYYRLPGQVYGYGPVLMSLPMIKTLNKAQELMLFSAALEMSGIFTRIDDGVFNPDTARIEPGAMWTVARNGGVLGPSIARLPSGNVQLGGFVLPELRQQVSMGMFDQQLPPDGQTPRSAAEIIERVRRAHINHAGAFGRLIHEIPIPAVRRALEILYKMGALQTNLKIDQLLVQMKITSPLGQAFGAERAQKFAQWVQAGTSLVGPELMHSITPLEQGVAEMGESMGVEPHLIRSEKERNQIQQQAVQAQMQTQMAQAAAQAQPAPINGDPARAA